MLCASSNTVNPIGEEILNSVDGQVNSYLSVQSTVRELEERYFPVKAEVMSNTDKIIETLRNWGI
jgi:hypothetical protein